MIKPALTIAGFSELESDFILLSKSEQRKLSKKAARAGAVVFRDAVRATAPIRTGRLQKSVSVATSRGAVAGVKFKKIRAFKNSGGKNKQTLPFYWWMIENGTSKMPARPFVRPAFDANVKKAEEAAFQQYLRDIDEIFLK